MLVRRITITKDVMDAFDFLWGLYINACEGTDEEWHSEEERRKLEKLHSKFYGD